MSEYIYNTAAKEATAFTKQRNAAFAREFQIDLEDAYNSEVALARRGCLKKLDGFRLKDKTGNVVWDLQAYDFLKQQAVADTVHPSLWLNGKANIEAGVFEVLPGKIYQVRGIDVANLTFVRSKTGWIAIDVTTNIEAAAYGLRIRKRCWERTFTTISKRSSSAIPTQTTSAASKALCLRSRWEKRRDRFAFTCRLVSMKRQSKKMSMPERQCSTAPSTSLAAICLPDRKAEFPQGWDWELLPERSAISRQRILLRRTPR